MGYVLNSFILNSKKRFSMENALKRKHIMDPHSIIQNTNIVSYIEKNKLYDTSKDNGIPAHELFRIAKKIYTHDNHQSCLIVNELDLRYFYAFDAYKAALNNDEELINHIIFITETTYQSNIDTVEFYIQRLLEIGFSIVKQFPYISLRIDKLINDTYTIGQNLPTEILDLSVEIVCSVADKSIGEALELIAIIEVNFFKVVALQKIQKKTNNVLLTEKIYNLINNINI